MRNKNGKERNHLGKEAKREKKETKEVKKNEDDKIETKENAERKLGLIRSRLTIRASSE